MKKIKRQFSIVISLIMIAVMLPFGSLQVQAADAKLFDATSISAAGVTDKDPIAEGTTFENGFFEIVGTVTQRLSSDGASTKSVEVAKALGGAIQFTITETSDVVVEMSSTGGANESAVALINSNDKTIPNAEGKTTVAATDKTTLTYTGLAVGTYRVVSPEDASRGRGARVYSITVSAVAGGASVTENYLFDSTTLSAAGVTDKDVIAEGTKFTDGYYKVVGKVTQRTDTDGSTKCIEIEKALLGALSFTVNGTANVTLNVSSTGGTNTSRVAIIDANENIIANNEALDSVSGTASTILTYTGLKAGTYRVVSPEDSNYKRGFRLITINTAQTSSGEQAARADWSSVAAPQITDVKVSEGKITVTYSMLIGYDGADKISITMNDQDGTECASSSSAADSTKGTMTFTPKTSGTYSFSITAYREKETDKTSVKSTVDFVLPLNVPSIANATSAGNGSVSVAWGEVPEAEKYIVSCKKQNDAEYTTAATVTTLTATVTGLTIGTTYTFAVQAVRGGETTERGILAATVSADAQRAWSFAAFGASINTTDNFYTGSALDGTVGISSINGKGKLVPASTDGIAYYYTTIDPQSQNFKLSATITVDSWTYSNGQDGFGMLVADAVGVNGDGSTFWNNSYSAFVSKVEYYWDSTNWCVSDTGSKKVSMKLGVGAQAKLGVTAELIANDSVNTNDFATNIFSSTMTTLETSQKDTAATYNIIGNCTNPPEGTVAESSLLTTFKFTIERNNTGYIVSYTDGSGKTTSKKYYDLERNSLTQIDKDNIYVGFFAARNASITVTDIELTTSDPATDAPAEEIEVTTVIPAVTIQAAKATGNEELEILVYTNADGTITITSSNGDTLAAYAKVTAGTYSHYTTSLAIGTNTITAKFTPDKNYKPSEYEVLSSYEQIQYQHEVVRKVFEQDVIYVSPKFIPDSSTGATGAGTKEDPTDIITAVKYATAGQIILLDGGEYLLSGTVRVERGNDGTAEEPIYMMANPEAEKRPILNFQGLCSGMVLGGDYWIFDGFDVTLSKDGQKGIQLSGNNCILQNVNAYYNGNTGIQISRYNSNDTFEDWPANNLILNCTSYGNADSGYEDADGFAAKLTVGEGNVFDGCISYNNADDGWDMYAKVETGPIGVVIIKNCVAYANGILPDGTIGGNGNGFKLGGESISGYHQVINCVAYDNKSKGIDSNSCPDIQVTNCTSFNNGSYNVALYTSNAVNTDYSVNGLITYRTENMGEGEQLKPKGTQDTAKLYGTGNFYYNKATQTSTNSEGTAVAADWFENLDTSTKLTRNSDGTINMNGLLVLTANAPALSGAVIGGTKTNDYTEVVTKAQEKAEDAEPIPTKAEATAAPDPTTADNAETDPQVTKEAGNAEPTSSANVTTAPVTGSDGEQDNKSNTVLIVIIISIAVLAAAAVGFVIIYKKKGTKKAE